MSYHLPVPWAIRLRKDNAKGSLVKVRSAIWTCLDSDKYIWDKNPQAALRRRKQVLRSFRGMKGMDLLRGGTIVDKHDQFDYGSTIGQGLESHWEVHFLTDERKATFFVDVKPANVSHLGVQSEFCKKEQVLMAAEDIASCETEIFLDRKEKIEALHIQIAKEMLKFRQKVAHALHAEQIELTKSLKILEKKQQQLRHNLDKWLLVRAQAIYTTSKACMTFKMNRDDEKAKKREAKQKEKDLKKGKKQDIPGKGFTFYPEYPVVSSSTYLASLDRLRKQFPIHPKYAKISNPSYNPYPPASAPDADVNTRNLMKCRVVNTHMAALHPVVVSVCNLFENVIQKTQGGPPLKKVPPAAGLVIAATATATTTAATAAGNSNSATDSPAAASAATPATAMTEAPTKAPKKVKIKEISAQEKAAEALQALLNSGGARQHPFDFEPTRVINSKGEIKVNIKILMSTVLRKGRVGRAVGAALTIRSPPVLKYKSEFMPFTTGMCISSILNLPSEINV